MAFHSRLAGGSLHENNDSARDGHALGLFHEQSRADRNAYVNYMEQNIDKPNHANFDIIGSDSIGSGLYNYASIMEYGPFTFDKDGAAKPGNDSIWHGARHQHA